MFELFLSPEDEVGGGQGLDDGPVGLALRSAVGPDRLVHRVEQLEAEAVLLGGPLDQLAGAEDDGADPVATL